MTRPKLSKTPYTKTPNPWMSSLRYMVAELRPLGKPEVWASGVILIILGLFAWEYWNQPANRNEFASDQPDSNFVDDAQAIAQDIDNSALLRQDLDSTALPNPPLNVPTTINVPNNANNANTSGNKSSLAPGVAAFLSLMTNSPLSNPSAANTLSPPSFGLGGTGGFNSSFSGLSGTPNSGGLLLANPGSSPSLAGLSPSPTAAIAPTSTALPGTGLNSLMGGRGINTTGNANLTGTLGTLSPTSTGLSGIGNTGIGNPVGTVGQSASFSSSPLPGSAATTTRPGIYIPPAPTAGYYTQPPQLTVPTQSAATPAIAPTSLNGVNAPYAMPGNQVGNGLGNPTAMPADQPIDPLDVEPDPFSVPRAAPGRYIGNGNINTFANP